MVGRWTWKPVLKHFSHDQDCAADPYNWEVQMVFVTDQKLRGPRARCMAQKTCMKEVLRRVG